MTFTSMTGGFFACSMTPRGSGLSACPTCLTLRCGLATLPALTGALTPAQLSILIVLGLILLVLVLLCKGGSGDHGYG